MSIKYLLSDIAEECNIDSLLHSVLHPIHHLLPDLVQHQVLLHVSFPFLFQSPPLHQVYRFLLFILLLLIQIPEAMHDTHLFLLGPILLSIF